MQTPRRLNGLLAALLLLISLTWFIARTSLFTSWDFRNNLWGPAYLLVHGQSPYRVDTLFELGNAVWMHSAIGLFFPLGWLPYQQAVNLWFVLNILWFLLIVWMCAGRHRPSAPLLAVVLLLSFLFPPLVTHIWSGQVSILISLVFLLAAYREKKSPVLFTAFLLVVGLSKPQLAILVLPGFLGHTWKDHGLRRAAQLLLGMAAWVLVLTVPLFLAFPGWLPDFFWAMRQNPSWAQPSSLYLLRMALPFAGTVLWLLLLLLVSAVNLRLWTVLPVQEAVLWSLALTPLVTPYLWTWDFVLLLPLYIAALFRPQSKLSFAVLLGGYLACQMVVTVMKVRGNVTEPLFWWVPGFLLAVLLAGQWAESRSGLLSRRPGMLG
jgi:hypothetical protein